MCEDELQKLERLGQEVYVEFMARNRGSRDAAARERSAYYAVVHAIKESRRPAKAPRARGKGRGRGREEDLSSMELERKHNIARNREVLESLGLV